MSNLFEEIKKRSAPYIINTLYDAVFTVMGIVIGSTFSATLDLKSIIGTIITVSLSLGVSSGFRVYEAEIQREERRVTLFSSTLVFLTPLLAGITTLIPFILVYLGTISIQMGVRLGIAVDLFLIFITGYVFAVENRLMKGLRMMILGFGVFIIGYLLNSIM